MEFHELRKDTFWSFELQDFSSLLSQEKYQRFKEKLSIETLKMLSKATIYGSFQPI